jgi:hypothetical protein
VCILAQPFASDFGKMEGKKSGGSPLFRICEQKHTIGNVLRLTVPIVQENLAKIVSIYLD